MPVSSERPIATRTCFECVHAAISGAGATFCTQFREEIMFERLAAQDCMAFEEAQ